VNQCLNWSFHLLCSCFNLQGIPDTLLTESLAACALTALGTLSQVLSENAKHSRARRSPKVSRIVHWTNEIHTHEPSLLADLGTAEISTREHSKVAGAHDSVAVHPNIKPTMPTRCVENSTTTTLVKSTLISKLFVYFQRRASYHTKHYEIHYCFRSGPCGTRFCRTAAS
jgi:hypothetical protein